MLLQIPALLTDAELQRTQAVLADGPWGDGRATAGPQAAQAKRNQQLAAASGASPFFTLTAETGTSDGAAGRKPIYAL